MDINIIICKYVCTLHIMLCQLRVTFFARLKKYYLVYFRKKESNRTWVHILTNHRGSNFQDGKRLEGWNYFEMCVLKRCAALLYYLIFAKIQFGKLRIITSRKQQELYIRILQMDRAPCYTSFKLTLTNLCWTQKMPLFWIMIKKIFERVKQNFFCQVITAGKILQKEVQ